MAFTVDGAGNKAEKETVVAEAAEGYDRQAQPIDTELPPRLPFAVVGIGASAGGLEAITEFLAAVRPDSGMAYVFIQHLSPTRDSMLAEILTKRTDIPVLSVDDGMHIEPNHLYVIRPGHTLTMAGGVFHLGERLARPMHNRPVDDFFKSLAEEQRERAIGIILAGMGSNGTAGAQAIKAVGGLCIAQEPETVEYSSMPRHLIDAGYADYILPAKDMAGVLLEYAGHPYASGQREEKAFLAKRDQQHVREILAILRTRTQQDFNGYKKPTVLRRIQRRIGLNRLNNLSEYAKLLRQSPAEVTALADDLLIHVTGFFRDAAAWETLRVRVIVPLVAGRNSDESIRCWVTACSSGEEAYTLAMLLMEEAERTNKIIDVKVFATDMAERTLANARNGLYPGGIESEITPERLQRFFVQEDAVYRVRPELRERVVFAPQNVLQDPPFSRLDIVSCRNMLIYLEPEMQTRILGLLHFSLREGGTLFLGTSETVNPDGLFEAIDKQARIYRRVGMTRYGLSDFAVPRAFARLKEGTERVAAGRNAITRPSMIQMTARALIDYHASAAVAIDREQRIVYYHGHTEPYISLPRGEPTRDFLEVVREGIRGAARTALQRAAATSAPATALEGWIENPGGGRMRVAVTASPLDLKNAAGHYVVSFQDRGPIETVKEAATGKGAGTADELHRIRSELQSTIEELQTSNEELKASHEEVVSTNEELQSANEELETGREEMQSLNEELSTVNAQLQAKIEEHQGARNDLASLLASTDIAVLFLDTKFRIRRYTVAIRDLMDIIATDEGRPLADLATKFDDPHLISDAESVLAKLAPIEREIVAHNKHTYMRRVLPYRTADHRIDGVVITFIDITRRKHDEHVVHESENRLGALVRSTSDVLYRVSPDWSEMRQVEGRGFLADATNPGSWLERYIHPDDRQRVTEAIEQAIQTKGVFEIEHRLRRDNGAYGWAFSRAVPLLDEKGEIVEWFGAVSDITTRKEAEEARRESEAQLGLVIESTREFAIIGLDANGMITGWNVGAERILGYTLAEAVGQPVAIIFTPEDREAGGPQKEMREAIATGRAVDERWHLRKSGDRFWGSGALASLRNSNGSVRGFIKVMRDDTDRKHAEELLQSSKETAELANKMKDEFLATLSHELRTPLSAILLWSKILQSAPGALDEQQLQEGLRAIRNSAEAQKELVEDLLDVSRITSGGLRLQIREIDLLPIVRDAIETVTAAAESRGITFEAGLSPDVGVVRVDPDRVRQVIWNLLSNAVKFSPDDEAITVTLRRDGGAVEIRVIDKGRGIEADFLPHVFERFRQADASTTRRHGGLGLGLAISKQIVELHGGTIRAESGGIDEGATFIVRLPLPKISKRAGRPDPASGAKSSPQLGSLEGLRVLLVEDDEQTRAALAILMRGVGMQVAEAESVPAAMLSFNKLPPDVIVSDIGLPGEDGYVLIRRIRAEEQTAGKKATPALALTAFARETDRRMAIEAGFQTHIGKPLDSEQLLNALRELAHHK